MVIIEGLDNTGKSTLALRLASDFKGLMVSNKRRPQAISDVLQWIDNLMMLHVNYRLFVDRVPHVSEPIYGPICRNTGILTPEFVSAVYRTLPATYVYCRPPTSTIFNMTKPEMEGVKENRSELLRAYDDWARIHEPIYYDYTDPESYTRLIGKIHDH